MRGRRRSVVTLMCCLALAVLLAPLYGQESSILVDGKRVVTGGLSDYFSDRPELDDTAVCVAPDLLP